MSARDGAKAVQYTLRALGKPVAADGVIGPRTDAAISSLTGQDRALVESLKARVAKSSQRPGWMFVSYATARNAVDAAHAETGAPLSYLAKILPIENVEVQGGYETTTSGTFRGLGQFNEQTWNGLRRLGHPLPPFSEGAVKPDVAMKAVGYLYKENRRSHVASFPGSEFTDELGYLYHNQGAPAAQRYLRTGQLVYPKQSEHALSVAASARSQHAKENRA